LIDALRNEPALVLRAFCHDLRNPLTAISGFAQLLREAATADRESVNAVLSNVRQIGDLLDSFQDLCLLERSQVKASHERFSPGDLVDAVCRDLQPDAAVQGTTIDCQIAPNCPGTMVGDPRHVARILRLLLRFALHVYRQGPIQVTAEACNRSAGITICISAREVDLGTLPVDQLFALAPCDRWAGTDPRGGLRFGLAVAGHLSELLGGRLTAERWNGAGLTMECQFQTPMPPDAANRNPEGRSSIPPPESPNTNLANSRGESGTAITAHTLQVRVLVVDDRRDVRLVAQRMIENAGGEVVIAQDGREAIEIIRALESSPQPIDVILMDIQLPSMDGLEAARELRATGFAKPLIALSGRSDEEQWSACLAAGFDRMIGKPIAAETLIQALREVTRIARPTL
jgi:CheY-like chemotaxis protein